MSVSVLAPFIVHSALRWLERSCRETSRNGGACIDEIHRRYAHYSPQLDTWRREAYCAKFSYIVVAEAASVGKGGNWLPPTASAAGMLVAARRDNRFPTDTTPSIGSVFYRKSTALGASGHVGIVVGMDTENIYSIEGNASIGGKQEGVGFFSIPRTDIPKRAFQFMHVEGARTERVWQGVMPNIRSVGIRDDISLVPLVLAFVGVSALYLMSSR